MLIQTTGLEDYAPGGKARVKVLVIGGPGAGKTRWASYFPKPFYLNCEGGLASVADRKMPYVNVNTSQDMLDGLAFLKQECQQPVENRSYDTVVVDTLDAFQRKVKDEWLVKEKKQVFTGWDAWGYMNSKMQMLMTRLLNLDMNILVLVHYKDKIIDEVRTISLQVQGDVADTVYNDFDLVAWMGTFWEPVDGERVQKRGLTFKPTPERPFLKDRLHVTPDWMEVQFADTDYTHLFDAIQSRVEDMDAGEVIGEITSTGPDGPPGPFVVPPGAIGSGALPPKDTRELTFAQMDKTTLLQRARDARLTTTVDGSLIKGNTTKSELIAALEAHTKPALPPFPAPPVPEIPPLPAAEPAAVANPRRTTAPATKTVPEGIVDIRTGELLDPEPVHPLTPEEAEKTLHDVLGAVPVQTVDLPEPPAPELEPAPQPTAVVETKVCETCAKDLTNENPDFVKLSWIKFRKLLCETCYMALKNTKR